MYPDRAARQEPRPVVTTLDPTGHSAPRADAYPWSMSSPRALSDDIRLLGKVLGDVIADQAGDATLDLVEAIRRVAVDSTADQARAASSCSTRCRSTRRMHVIRASATSRCWPTSPRTSTTPAVVAPISPADAAAAAARSRTRMSGRRRRRTSTPEPSTPPCRSEIVPVLTAHPTEMRRKTIHRSRPRSPTLMDARDRAAMTDVEAAEWRDDLWLQVVTLWQTAMLRLTKLRVRDEINDALRYYDLSLLSQVPRARTTPSTPRSAGRPDRERPMLRMGSWIGGDRDGNPFVTAEVLADAVEQQATTALGHHLDELWHLADELSMSSRLVHPSPSCCSWPTTPTTTRRSGSTSPTARRCAACTPGWRRRREQLVGHVPGRRPDRRARAVPSPGASCWPTSTSSTPRCAATAPMRRPTVGWPRCAARSRCSASTSRTLDLRQNSAVHEQVVDELLERGGVCADYVALDRGRAGRRCSPRSWRRARPLLGVGSVGQRAGRQRAGDPASRRPRDAAHARPGCVANYVISGCESVSDVLEVAVLFREVGLMRAGPNRSSDRARARHRAAVRDHRRPAPGRRGGRRAAGRTRATAAGSRTAADCRR